MVNKPAGLKHIIGITGYSATGKSTLAEHLSKELRMGAFSLGNYQRKEFAAYGQPLEYHEKLGLQRTYYSRWPAYISEISKNISEGGIVVEGIYSSDFLALVKESFNIPVHVIGVTASQERRESLLALRAGLPKDVAESRLIKMDRIKIDVGIEGMFGKIDVWLENDCTLEEFKNKGKDAAIHLLLRR